MKKFLVSLKDRSDNKVRKYIVKAENMEEAFSLAIDYYNRRNRKKKDLDEEG